MAPCRGNMTQAGWSYAETSPDKAHGRFRITRSVRACKTAVGRVLAAVLAPVLFRTVTIGNRKVRLYRHIPLLGTADHLLHGGITRCFMPAAECRSLANSKDIIFSCPHSQTSIIRLGADEDEDKLIGILAGPDSSKPLIRGVYGELGSQVVRSALLWGLAYSVYSNGIGLYSLLLNPAVIVGGLVGTFVFSSIHSVLNKRVIPLQYNIWFWKESLYSVKGTMISHCDTDALCNDAFRLADQIKQSPEASSIAVNNCSKTMARLVKAGAPKPVQEKLREPLVSWTPLNTLMQVHNINAMNRALFAEKE